MTEDVKIKVVSLKNPPNPDLVEMLEDLLALAKEGELVSGNFAGSMRNGDIMTNFSSTDNRLLEIAALSRLLHRIHLASDEAARS